MKRELTFELRTVYPDWKVRIPKELEKRIGKAFKLLGEIKAGNKLELHFEDGHVFKTAPLDIQGYITKRDDYDDDKVVFVTLCTKDMYYEMDVIDKKIKLSTVEQLKLI
ncbi:hypothetical protein [Romboutsia sp.]|uniref:hypothetical protein n=1 Tax=Romboutsia sp. TaxID=1965302 RepID=UPI002B8E86B4|nr:hypothetical protein [Romboutsia sp.]HSQ89770.1 hypothetical protein [Romboutsia sp.]